MFTSIFRKIVRGRSEEVARRISSYIKQTDKIIDIGSGSGDVSLVLQSQGMNTTPVDVGDFHGPRLIKTIIYDGKKLPFKDQSFNKALLLMVMHHTPNPELIFREATRVAKEIVVIETSYATSFAKIHTVITDAIGNLRLEAFWNSYKTDQEWRKIFNINGFKVVDSHKYHDRNIGLPFLHISYYLKRKSNA